MNGDTLTADHIVIATGSKPRALPIPGAELMVTTDEVPEGDRVAVNVEIEDETRRLVADRVVNGAGRVANVDPLNSEAAGVEHDGVAIKVDNTLRSASNRRVYVAGDALVCRRFSDVKNLF